MKGKDLIEGYALTYNKIRHKGRLWQCRGVRNLFEDAFKELASCLAPLLDNQTPIDASTLTTFEASDIQYAGDYIESHRL